jgi:serine protease Do
VSIQEVTQDLAQEFGTASTKGALVADVMEESPAGKAKLERGDIITAYNGTTINDPGQLRALVAETAPGTTVTLSIVREKKPREVTIKIGELPRDIAKGSRGRSEAGRSEHALAGISVENVAPDKPGRFGRSKSQSGVVVTEIEPDSPGERAGLRTGDVIREINRKPVRDVRDFERLTNQLTARTPVLLLLNRGNATIFLSINPNN